MAQQPPTQPPAAQPPEEPMIIVRGSEEHKDYLKHQFGRIKEMVNSFETRIAVAGRALLLIYVVYITVKAATANSLPHNVAWLSIGLVVLDIVMQALQVLGLEGSVPGLIHLAEELENKGKTKEAGTIRFASGAAQWLLAFTAIDIVLESNHTWGGQDITGFAIGYTNCLFIVRVIVIGLYLVAMARLEHKGPRIISAHEAARIEQEQIRMDNAAIQTSISQAMDTWTENQQRQQQARNEESMTRWLEEQRQIIASHLTAHAGPTLDIQSLTEAIYTSLAPQFLGQIEAVRSQNEVFKREQSDAMKRFTQTIEAKFSPSTEVPRRSAERPTNSRPEVPAVPGILPLPSNGDRAAQKIRVFKLIDEEGLNAPQAAAKTGVPLGTIHRWLKERKDAQERPGEAQHQAKDA